MRRFHYKLRRFCAFLIGAVFVMAGVFKLLDPVGAGLVMEDYFKFFHIQFLDPIAKALATLLALFETIVGSALITGVWRRLTAIVTSIMLAFFTVLTLILAIFNPPMDCGCFGEFIHLTNLQTFLKNLILLALAAIAFLPFKEYGDAKRWRYISFWIASGSLLIFMVLMLVHIPIVDYTEFKPGSELFASTDNPSEAYDDIQTKVIYEKNGQEGAFPIDKLPDSTWTFVRVETVRTNGEENENFPILSFTDADGNYMDEMATDGDVLVSSVYKPQSLKAKDWATIHQTLENALRNGFVPLLLVSCSKEAFDSLEVMDSGIRTSLDSLVYMSDFKTLVSLNRSNGGFTQFSDGELIRKFGLNSGPSEEKLQKMANSDPEADMLSYSTRGRTHFQMFFLYLFIVLILL